MSSHYHHEPSSSRLDGETDQFFLRDGPSAGSSTPNNQQADAKRDRRRQQVREAQARFRDRKDRTVEELKHRTMLLSEALEKVKADNRVLRARLSRYERVDLVGDDPMDTVVGPSARSQGPATWPISSTGQRQRRPSSEESRQPLMSEPSVPGWEQGDGGYVTAEPLPLGTSTPFGGRDQANMPPGPKTYDPGMASNQDMQDHSHQMSQSLDPGRLNLGDDSPISAAEARYRKLQEDLMDPSPADLSKDFSATYPDRSRPQQLQAPRIELTQPGGGWATAMPNFDFGFAESGLAPQRGWRGSLSPGQQMQPPGSMQLHNQGRQNSRGGGPGNAGGYFADGGEQQSSQGRRSMQGPPIGENMQTPLGRVSRWQASMAPTDMFDVVPEVSSRRVDQLSSNGRRDLADGNNGRGRRPSRGR